MVAKLAVPYGPVVPPYFASKTSPISHPVFSSSKPFKSSSSACPSRPGQSVGSHLTSESHSDSEDSRHGEVFDEKTEPAESLREVPRVKKGNLMGCANVYASSHNLCGNCGDWDDTKPSENSTQNSQSGSGMRDMFAIICGRAKAVNGSWRLVHLWIKDERLRAALEPIFVNHFYVDPTSIPAPFHPFSQQWAVLNDLITNEHDGPTRQNLTLLREVLKPTIAENIEANRNLMKTGRINYEGLREAFVPGEVVVSKTDDGCLIAGILGSIKRIEFGATSFWRLDVSHFDWDGIQGLMKQESYEVKPYGGTRRLADLDVFPLDLHPDKEEIKMRLISRGRKFESLRHGVHIMHYKGKAKDPDQPGKHCDLDDYSVKLDERVIIATKYFHDWEWSYPRPSRPANMLNPRDVIATSMSKTYEIGHHQCKSFHSSYRSIPAPESYCPPDKAPDMARWTDEQCLMAVPYIRAFSESRKTWYKFNLVQLSDIAWDLSNMDKLILDEDSKHLMRCTTSKLASDGSAEVNDLGVFMILLWGVPGTGKTMTVKAACEEQGLIPYNFDVTAVANLPCEFKQELEHALRRCTHFNIPLLIRDAHHILGNINDSNEQSLISTVFLQEIEEFQGLILLLTNKNETLAPAIESRIDARLHYDHLSMDTRGQLWSNELAKDRISDEDMTYLASHQLDGRQIKGIAKLARLFAENDPDQETAQKIVNTRHLQKALDVRLRDSKTLLGEIIELDDECDMMALA